MGEIHVWSVALRQEPQAVECALPLLSVEEQAHARDYRAAQLRADAVVVRGVLRALLARYCGMLPAAIPIRTGATGKPLLECESRVRFNLSHSGGMVAYAITLDEDVGIDIEECRPFADAEAIADRFFALEEAAELRSLPSSQRLGTFYECWVRKEAYVKALGGGLSIPLDSFRVSFGAGRPPALLNVAGNPDEAAEWSILAFSPAVGFSGAVACRARGVRIRTLCAQPSDLLGTVPHST